jgi:hypothetical protein
MKAEFYPGASRTRVHIMDDFGNTTMMSAHVFTDEAQAQAFFELWEMATSAAQRDLLWVIGMGEQRRRKQHDPNTTK